MSTAIIVTRIGRSAGQTRIALEEWHNYVTVNALLRIEEEPPSATNPISGEEIKLARRPTAAEILIDGKWTSFLWWQNGELSIKYHTYFDNPVHPIRQAIVAAARHFSSQIITDVDDTPLDW